ncbi:hypothetical protein ES708_34601 [subsurface metagenome]
MKSTRPGSTPIFTVHRIARELLNESGRYQTTPESKLEQVTCQDIGTQRKVELEIIGASKNVKLEKTDAGSNESLKPSTDELHVDRNLDTPAAPIIIAGSKTLSVAAGRELALNPKHAGRRFFLMGT